MIKKNSNLKCIQGSCRSTVYVFIVLMNSSQFSFFCMNDHFNIASETEKRPKIACLLLKLWTIVSDDFKTIVNMILRLFIHVNVFEYCNKGQRTDGTAW